MRIKPLLRHWWLMSGPLAAMLLATACSLGPTRSTPQSPTQIVPRIDCGENAPALAIPAYPSPTGTDVVALRSYSAQQQKWAAQAIGVINDERIKRQSVAACLADYRRAGIIN